MDTIDSDTSIVDRNKARNWFYKEKDSAMERSDYPMNPITYTIYNICTTCHRNILFLSLREISHMKAAVRKLKKVNDKLNIKELLLD